MNEDQGIFRERKDYIQQSDSGTNGVSPGFAGGPASSQGGGVEVVSENPSGGYTNQTLLGFNP